MSAFKDLTSKRFGRLLVLSRVANKGKQTMWLCLCDCGKTNNVQGGALNTNATTSCGCYKSEVMIKKSTTHGMSESTEHSIWSAMKKRCFDPKSSDYPRYGGRGITVCERWKDSFSNFYADMGSKPEGCSIDRIDFDGNYEPMNCKWSTHIEQANNKSNNCWYEYGDERHTIAEWSRISGLPYSFLNNRLKKGMPMPYALLNIDYRVHSYV